MIDRENTMKINRIERLQSHQRQTKNFEYKKYFMSETVYNNEKYRQHTNCTTVLVTAACHTTNRIRRARKHKSTITKCMHSSSSEQKNNKDKKRKTFLHLCLRVHDAASNATRKKNI